MSGMRRSDRRTKSDDNSDRYPASSRPEPASSKELKQLLANARSQRDEAQQELQQTTEQLTGVQQELQVTQQKKDESEKLSTQNYQLYLDEQQQYQQTLVLYNQEKDRVTALSNQYKETDLQRTQYLARSGEWEARAGQHYQLYLEEQQNHQQTLTLYDQEKAKVVEWQTKHKAVDTQLQRYIALYDQAQSDLKSERRSKAGIKGWETRRKSENERLKQEIKAMAEQLRDSLSRKDEAIDELYTLAERMDKIQQIIDSVDENPTNTPVNMVQKFKQIWLAIREILAD